VRAEKREMRFEIEGVEGGRDNVRERDLIAQTERGREIVLGGKREVRGGRGLGKRERGCGRSGSGSIRDNRGPTLQMEEEKSEVARKRER